MHLPQLDCDPSGLESSISSTKYGRTTVLQVIPFENHLSVPIVFFILKNPCANRFILNLSQYLIARYNRHYQWSQSHQRDCVHSSSELIRFALATHLSQLSTIYMSQSYCEIPPEAGGWFVEQK